MVEERVRDVIASVFSVHRDELPARLEPDTLPGWTSLRQVQLVIALEKEFGVEVDPTVIPDLVSERAIVEMLAEARS